MVGDERPGEDKEAEQDHYVEDVGRALEDLAEDAARAGGVVRVEQKKGPDDAERAVDGVAAIRRRKDEQVHQRYQQQEHAQELVFLAPQHAQSAR